MDRGEKLRLSADEKYGHCFKQGMFLRLYEQSLYRFSHTVKPLKPMLERVRGGDPVIYGGLPIGSFEKLLEDGALPQAQATDYGWRWPYAEQGASPPFSENAPDFAAWRAYSLASASEKKNPAPPGNDILTEIASFNLAAHTPMQAMNAIAGWQDVLRNREGAER